MELVRSYVEPAARVEPWSTLRGSRRLALAEFFAWECYIIFQTLDLLTTYVGLETVDGVVETNPLVAAAIGATGIGSLVVIALAKIGLYVVLFRSLPRPFRVIVPVLASIPTLYVVQSNFQILRIAVGI